MRLQGRRVFLCPPGETESLKLTMVRAFPDILRKVMKDPNLKYRSSETINKSFSFLLMKFFIELLQNENLYHGRDILLNTYYQK